MNSPIEIDYVVAIKDDGEYELTNIQSADLNIARRERDYSQRQDPDMKYILLKRIVTLNEVV